MILALSLSRRSFAKRLVTLAAVLSTGLPRMPERAYIWLDQWEQYGAEMYRMGWRVVDAEYGDIFVSRYIIER